jgi:RecQ family ATP-dependent DNA helicase
MKDIKELVESGCPWFQGYSAAAFASEAVVRLLDPRLGFASFELRSLFRARAGCTFALESAPDKSQPTAEGKFLGAVLSKLAHRGEPTPCSLAVERHFLHEAQEAGVLDYRESSATGEFRFSARPKISDLAQKLRACCIPELLIGDDQVQPLLERYRSLCTAAETELLEQLLQLLPDRRLGLLWLPQRLLASMLRPSNLPEGSKADRVDFSLEVPYLSGRGWLRLVIELDDDSHSDAQLQKDRDRDRALATANWGVLRLHVRRRSEWAQRLLGLLGPIDKAIPAAMLQAAEHVRNLPEPQRRAIQNLILLPAAEGQVLAAVGALVFRGYSNWIRIGDPQKIGIAPVLKAVDELVDQLARLHKTEALSRVDLSPRHGDADLLYFAHPDASAWDAIRSQTAGVIASRPVASSYHQPLRPASPRPVDAAATDISETVQTALQHILQNIFRKKEFRPGQMEIIGRALTLRPVVGLLPTGAGKSLCFQLASLTQPGFALVVDPLRALMLDQQQNLEALGIHRSQAILSGLEATEVKDQAAREEAQLSITQGHYLFVFVAPERLQMPRFRHHLRSFSTFVPIPYCVVDEAHCVSEWGHDFRPSYLNVGRIVMKYCRFGEQPPCLMALTGTASRNVLIDIMRELGIDDQEALVEPKSFDRKELDFEVCRVNFTDRLSEVSGKLRSILAEAGYQPGQPGEPPSGLIFTNFATAAYVGVQVFADEFRRLGIPVEIYCGRKPYGFSGTDHDWERRKLEIQRQFKQDETPILVCNHGFGMGIDKPNIRFTIHAMLPRSLEDFYQQAGRAGRDRQIARCIIVFSDDQERLADELLDTERTPLEVIARKANFISKKAQGDAVRNTWFLTSSFIGREQEKAILRHVVITLLLPRLSQHEGDAQEIEVPFAALPGSLFEQQESQPLKADTNTAALEKALYRLLLVGAVTDYMKDYNRRCFLVVIRSLIGHQIRDVLEAYLRRYATEFEVASFLPSNRTGDWAEAATTAASALIDYIYATIEKRRRRAIGQMLQTARDASRAGVGRAGSAKFREQLLAYLEESEFSKPVATLAGRIHPPEWFEILSQVRGIDGVTKLLGACRRRLEESPSHPGLLILAGICRTASPYTEQGTLDIRSGFVALERCFPDPLGRVKIAELLTEHVRRLASSQVDSVLLAVLEGDPSYAMARFCYLQADDGAQAHEIAFGYLVSALIDDLQEGEPYD